MREDPAGRLPVVGIPLLRVIEQMIMIEHPLIGRRSHRHRAYVSEKARERLVVTFRAIDLEEPIERIVLVRDVPVETGCRVVLGLRHAVTLPGPGANPLGWASVRECTLSAACCERQIRVVGLHRGAGSS